MAKQLNVNLGIQADTSKARKQLQELQGLLQNIQSKPTTLIDDQNLNRASQAAATLQRNLTACTDVNTGKLDLTKFALSLNKSGQKLEVLKADLESIGPEGTKAFLSLAQSIANANAPMIKLNSRMQEFLTTLKNTTRWQISSSVVHGLMGGLSKAYRFAQDLNESLNSIRIVTGQSTEQMAAFAERANDAAKKLGTTTTAYTDAALIFYQQGLNDKLVKEYTDVTIKMANVSGDGATEVSSYMTAIWNNFNKQSDESAEHFADVLTALGASTASSTSEIAAGLEKFASIAEVTGLSYDYAASALATLVANTRQSADTVGTSLKTIFSRLQGLKLGETLEDGVDLNKYSEALQKIGVEILDASGNIRKLDDILEDTASHWSLLTEAQQMATAQTVAGVRQYNQFIALMNNWEDMQTNLATARNSDGTLQEQAAIYEESWEAARKHVKASLEDIYKDLIDDKFFISFSNGLASMIDGIGGLIKGFGGVKGILLLISEIFMRSYAKKMPEFLNSVKENLMIITSKADKLAQQLQAKALKQVNQIVEDDSMNTQEDLDLKAQVQGTQEVIKMKAELAAHNSELTESERMIYEEQIKQVQASYDKMAARGDEITKAKAETDALESQIAIRTSINKLASKKNDLIKKGKYAATLQEENKLITKSLSQLKNYCNQYARLIQAQKTASKQGKIWSETTTDIESTRKKIREYVEELKNSGKIDIKSDAWQEVQKAIKDTTFDVQKAGDAIEALGNDTSAWQSNGKSAQALSEEVDKLYNKLVNMGAAPDELRKLQKQWESNTISTEQYEAELARLEQKTKQSIHHQMALSEALVGVGSSVMAVSQLMNAMKSFGEIFSNDTDVLTKITTSLGILGSVVMTLNTLMTLQNKLKKEAARVSANVVAAQAGEIVSHGLETSALWAKVLAIMSNPYMTGACIAAIAIACVAIGAMTAKTQKETEAHQKNADAAREELEAKQELTETHKELIEQYKSGLQVLNETGEVSESLQDATLKLAEAYDIEGAALANLTGKYDDYTAAINRARKKEVAEAKNAAQAAKDEAGQVFIDAMRKDTGRYDGNKYIADIGTGAKTADEQGVYDLWKNKSFKYITAMQGGDLHIKSGQSAEEMAAAYEEVQAFLAELSSGGYMTSAEMNESELVQGLRDWAEKSKDSYDKYQEAMGSFKDYSAELATLNIIDGVDGNGFSGVEEYEQTVQKIVKARAEELGINDKNSEEYKNLTKEAEKYLDVYVSNAGQLKTVSDAIDDIMSNQSFDSVMDKKQYKKKMIEFYESLSDEEKTLFFSIDFDEKDTEENWNRQMDYLRHQAQEGQLEIQIDAIVKVRDAINSGNAIGEEDRADISNKLSELGMNGDEWWKDFDLSTPLKQTRMLNQLSNEWNAHLIQNHNETEKLIEDAEKELEEYQAKRRELQALETEETTLYNLMIKMEDEGLDFIDYEGQEVSYDKICELWADASERWVMLADDMGDASEQIIHEREIKSRIDELTNELQDFSSVITQVYTNEVDNIVSYADRAREAAEMIGEGFIVAKEDAQKFAAIYPELLSNAQVLADGSIQLTEAEVNAVLDGDKAKIKADTEVLTTKLENQLEILRMEIAYKKEKMQAMADFCNGEISYSDLKEKLAQTDTEFINKMKTSQTEHGITNDQLAAASNGELTTNVLENIDLMGNKVNEFGEALRAAMAGEGGKYKSSTTNTAIDHSAFFESLGVDAQTSEADARANLSRATTEQQAMDAYKQLYAAMLAEMDKELTEQEKQEASYVALLSKLKNGTNSAYEAFKNVGLPEPSKITEKEKKPEKEDTPKDPEKKSKKHLEDNLERYHEIEEALKDINRELDRLDKTESRTYGKGRMAAIKSKIAGLKNEAQALAEYANEAEKYYKQDLANATKAGWTFDESGNVSNYDENLKALQDKYNAIIEAYNNMSAEQQEEYKKQTDAEGRDPLQQAEEEYKNALDALKQYEETADKYEEIQDKILENRRNIADAQLEEIELTVELKLEVNERNIALLEELFENMGDSADYVVDKIENIEKRIDAVVGKVKTTRQAMKDTFDLLGEYNENIDGGVLERMLTGNMTSEDLQNIADAVSNSDGVLNYDEIMANIKEYADSLLQYNQELRDLRESVYNELENAMDKYSEEFDKVDDKIAHSKKMLSGYKDIVSALGKANVDPTGALTRRLNENTIKTNESDWRAANARQEAMKKAKADAEEGLRKAKESGSEYDIERWTKILEKAQEDLVSAEENAQDKLVEWIESIGEAFKAEIEQVIEDLDKELGGLTNLRENFDRQQTLNEQYVDDYEKIYQLSKMTRDINKTIDETDSVNAKKALMEFQQKINKYQEDGVQMSQYEVENLQRQLELEKAKIQLDEAKDEKSQVRMQRDAEGNYGYVYTANETDVAAAEQNYEDKLHEIQVANGSYINELQDSIITMQEECSAKIKEIMLDESLSMEERMAKVEETRDYYQKRLEYYSGQLGIVLDNNKELYENEWLEYSERTGYKISRNEDYVDSWQETSLGILTETENQAAYMERVEEAIGNATDRMAEAMENYQDRTSEAMDQAGYDIDNLAEDIGDRSDEVTEDAQNAADEAERLEDEYEQHLGDAMDATIDFTENYGQAIQNCIDENNRIIDSINDVIAALAEMASTAESSYNNINIPNVPSGGGSDTPGAGGGTSGGETGGDTGNVKPAYDYTIAAGDTLIGITSAKKTNPNSSWKTLYAANQSTIDNEAKRRGMDPGGHWIFPGTVLKIPAGFDTGGYTGDWGSSMGKFAMLHQKELVLNADDTSNMLDIVSMVRDISKMIDMNALSSMIASGLTAATVSSSKNDVIEQHVEITAEFHDATTATEITDAFENLINRATQYANRK